MRADDWSIVHPSARGRDSIRISSLKAYPEAIFVIDVEHMPTGCGTWPAFWTLSKAGPWPKGGEIDIIEGQNTPRVSPWNRCEMLMCAHCDPLQVSMRISITEQACILPQIVRCHPK